MTKKKETTTPPSDEANVAEKQPAEEVKPVPDVVVEEIIDPREAARKRSKDDLQRKRRNLRGGRGGF